MAEPGLGPDVEAGLALHAPDPMVATDLDGNVQWANLVAERRFGRPDRPVVGSHVLEWVVDDDHEQAVLAMGATAAMDDGSPDRMVLVPAPYRLRHGDGTEQWYEVAGTLHPGTGEQRVLITVLRQITRQQHLSRAVELIAGGGEFDEVLRELLRGFEHVDPRRTGGISWLEDGRRRTVALGIPEAMVTSNRSGDPWNRAIATGEPVGAVRSQMAGELAALADEVGLMSCAAVPVADPGSRQPACFVMWADSEAVVDSLQHRAHRQVHSLVHLALTQRHERQQLRHAATHDSLTGLLNRGALLDALHRFEAAATVVSLLYLDLDDFKPVNDAHGHEAGDEVLRIIAGRLAGAVRSEDLVARVGGDELAVAAIGLHDAGELTVIAERLAAVIGQPIAIDRGGVPLTTKVGVSVGVALPDPPGPRSADALLAAGDSAMYAAKRSAERHISVARV